MMPPHRLQQRSEWSKPICISFVVAEIAVGTDGHEASFAQSSEVLRNRTKTHVEVGGQVSRTHFFFPHQLQDFSTVPVGNELHRVHLVIIKLF